MAHRKTALIGPRALSPDSSPAAMTSGRPSRRDLALFSSPCIALAGVGLPLTLFLPNFYASRLGLSLSSVGVAFMTVRLVDIGVDPLLGVLMDRTCTRWGRYRPWL